MNNGDMKCNKSQCNAKSERFIEAEKLAVTTARILAVEAISKAKSGHPGLPLGAGAILYSIFREMKFDPTHTDFIDRDRFVLSAGHGSALLYSMMHLFGYDITIDDIKEFRQFGSKTPGHPEHTTAGIDASTGPLGHGIANAVGMAISEARLAAEFNTADTKLIDHYTYALCGEGCLMEGVGYEAVSLAGTLALNKLIVLYDKNNITIEGDKDIAFDENVKERFIAQHWNVIEVKDGNSVCEIVNAIRQAKNQKSKPTLIIVETIIGEGSPLQGTAAVHGAPLNDENLRKTKEFYNWNYPAFTVPEEAYYATHCTINAGKKAYCDWESMLDEYKTKHSKLYNRFLTFFGNQKVNFKAIMKAFDQNKDYATRASSEIVINELSKKIPNLFGGSADLGPSNLTVMKNKEYFSKTNRKGNNIHFGIREHAMACICNGIALHGGLIPYCATFFVFSDFLKAGIRLSALMELPVIYVLTHDSIGVGEDGATHQPIEQLAGLRSIPNCTVYRPYNNYEVVSAYEYALNANGPTAIVLSRQAIKRDLSMNKNAQKGAYVVRKGKDLALISTGSEVAICLEVANRLEKLGIDARVISMPSMEIYDSQTEGYKQTVLPKRMKKRVAVEALSSFGWHKYTGLDGMVISVDQFGCSSKPEVLFKEYGINADDITQAVLGYLE